MPAKCRARSCNSRPPCAGHNPSPAVHVARTYHVLPHHTQTRTRAYTHDTRGSHAYPTRHTLPPTHKTVSTTNTAKRARAPSPPCWRSRCRTTRWHPVPPAAGCPATCPCLVARPAAVGSGSGEFKLSMPKPKVLHCGGLCGRQDDGVRACGWLAGRQVPQATRPRLVGGCSPHVLAWPP